nr:uncharacterized mitochondrial protein AtMg00810-like [Tanacetum cinerariifolium]
FVRPFGCLVTIFNTLDPPGKFDGKANEGFLVGYSVSSKAFRVFNSNTRIIQETLHINFLKNQPNVARSGPIWLFDTDSLTQSMNYQPVVAVNQPYLSAGIPEHFDADKAGEGNVQQYVLFPLWSTGSKDLQNTDADTTFEVKEPESAVYVSPSNCEKTKNMMTRLQERLKETVMVNTVSTPVTTIGKNSTNNTNTFSAAGPSNTVVSPTLGKYSYVDPSQYPDDLDMPALEDIIYLNDAEDVGAEADFSNLETNITVSPILTTRVHKDHPVSQIIGDLSLAPQTRSMIRIVKELKSIMMPFILACLPAFFLKKNPKGYTKLLKILVEEGIDYEKVFAPVAKIEAIRLFQAYASFMGFVVYQMDVKSAFLYGTIKKEVYVCQPSRFEDPDYPDKVYKVVKALDRLHQAPRAWYETFANYHLENDFQKGKIDQTLFIKKQKGDILLVAKILRKFGLTDRKSASTPIDTYKPLLKGLNGKDVDVHTYRSMIGSLMYLTSSRPDIMFAVCACAHFRVTLKALHLHAVKRIFRYLKGTLHLGLWYLKDSPFNLVAYAIASLDRKSTTRGCQFLGCRLISWQCKKKTIVVTSSIEAKYVAVASCCAQVIWIQNQLLDYSPDQTVSGKDSSNPLMADNLPKIIWYSTHHVALMKSWLVQKQMAIDKDDSNPFIVDSLLRTI